MDFSCEQEKKCYEKVISLRDQLSKCNKEELSELENQLRLAEISLEKYEILLKENPQRFVLFPTQYDVIWKQYKKHQASFWTAEEVTLLDDLPQWNASKNVNNNSLSKLSENDKFFIKHMLAFFASADGIVNENLAKRFYGEVQIPEARCFYGFQIAMENIHGEVYSMLIDQLVSDPEEKKKLFEAVTNYPSVGKLANWALKWLNSDLPFNCRLIAFACVEGILFSGPFCAIFWLKKRGLMPGVTFSNELISRDEGLHTDFAALLNSILKYPATASVITKIVIEAIELQKEFIIESLPCNLIGMNSTAMGQYIEYVGDYLLQQLNVEPHWKTKNPFEWMELISVPNITNFFEKRVGEYNKSKVNSSSEDNNGIINDNSHDNIQLLDNF